MVKFSKDDIELFIHYFKCNRIQVHEKDMMFEDVYKEFLEYDFDYIAYILLIPYVKGFVKIISEEENDDRLIVKFIYKNKERTFVLNKIRALMYKFIKLAKNIEYSDDMCTGCDDYEVCRYNNLYFGGNEPYGCIDCIDDDIYKILKIELKEEAIGYLEEFIKDLLTAEFPIKIIGDDVMRKSNKEIEDDCIVAKNKFLESDDFVNINDLLN